MSRRLSRAALLGLVLLAACREKDGSSPSPELSPPGRTTFGSNGPAPDATAADRRPPDHRPPDGRPDPQRGPELSQDTAPYLRPPADGVTPQGTPVLQPVSGRGRAVIIGDSHTVGGFGDGLREGLTRHGLQVAQFSISGAQAASFLRANGTLALGYKIIVPGQPNRISSRGEAAPPVHEELSQLLAGGPDLVVIALGANGGLTSPAFARDLIKKVPEGKRCIWVGPPPMPAGQCPGYSHPNFGRDLQAVVASAGRACDFVDSAPLIRAELQSGCHFASPCAAHWGALAAARITGATPPADPGNCAPRPAPAR